MANIGEVSINLRLSMAKFAQDVKQGQAATQQAAQTMGASVASGSAEATGALRVLNADLSLHLPRAVQSLIATLPGLSAALSAAFPVVAVVAIGKAVYDLVGQLQKASEAAEAARAALDFSSATGASDTLGKISESLADAQRHLKELQTGLKQFPSNAEVMKKSLDGLLPSLEKYAADQAKLIEEANSWTGKAATVGLAALQAAFEGLTGINISSTTLDLKAFNDTVLQTAKTSGAAAALKQVTDQIARMNTPVSQQTQEFKDQLVALEGLKKGFSDIVAQGFVDTQINIRDKVHAATEEMKKANEAWQKWYFLVAKAKDEAGQLATSMDSTEKAIAGIDLDEVNTRLWTMASAMTSVTVNSSSLAKELGQITTGNQDVMNQAAQELIDSTETQNQKLMEQVSIYEALRDAGKITDEQLNSAMVNLNNSLQTANKFYEQMGRTLRSGLVSSMTDLLSGTANWRAELEKTLEKMAAMVAEAAIMKELMLAIPGASTPGSFLSGLFGGRAEGGPVDANVPYWVGERRTPELFVPSVPGTIVPASQVGAGGSSHHVTNVNMNVATPDANSFGRSQAQLMADAYRNARIAQAQNSGR